MMVDPPKNPTLTKPCTWLTHVDQTHIGSNPISQTCLSDQP